MTVYQNRVAKSFNRRNAVEYIVFNVVLLLIVCAVTVYFFSVLPDAIDYEFCRQGISR